MFNDLTLGENITKTNKWDYIKYKRVCMPKYTNKKFKCLFEWEKIFVYYNSDEGLIPRYINLSYGSITTTNLQPHPKMGKGDKYFLKEVIWMDSRHVEKYSSGNCVSKQLWEVTLHQWKWYISKILEIPRVTGIWWKRNPHSLFVGMSSDSASMGSSMEISQKM